MLVSNVDVHCCSGAGVDEMSEADERRLVSLLNAVVGCMHKCLMYNREDKENNRDVGGLFTIDCMKMIMSPLVYQVMMLRAICKSAQFAKCAA